MQLGGINLIYILFFVTFPKFTRQLDKKMVSCHFALMDQSNQGKAINAQLAP